jgi:hypothetical protein
MTGDGFIAALPFMTGDGHEARTLLQRFLDAFASFTSLLNDVDQRFGERSPDAAPNPRPILGSRLAIHFGSFRYGKMALASSLSASFDGAAITDVARLEQGLRHELKGAAAHESQLTLSGEGHVVAISDQAVQAIGSLAEAGIDAGQVEAFTARSKEAGIPAVAFELKPRT